MHKLSLNLLNFDQRASELRAGDSIVVGHSGQMYSVTQGDLRLDAPLPLLARIVDPYENRPSARMPVAHRNGIGILELRLERKSFQKIYPRNVFGAIYDFDLAIAPHITFEPGETVRVRDERTGRILRADFVGRPSRQKYELRDTDGGVRLSPIRLVY